MKNRPILILSGFLLISFSSFSQKDSLFALRLRSGNFIPQKNITQETVSNISKRLQKVNGKSFAILQFDQLPTAQQKMELAAAGMELMEYVTGNAYHISFNKELDFEFLQKAGARAIFELTPEQKMHPAMAKGIFPSWGTKTPGLIDVRVSFPKTISFEEIRKLLMDNNIRITSTDYKEYHVIGLQIGIQRITELAAFPFIEYVEAAPHGDQLLNYESKNNSRGNILQSASAVGGFNLKGEGVTIGVGDNSDPQYHVDFTGRLINFGPAGYAYHGTHVHGTVGGAGIVNEIVTGYAPKSRMITQYFGGIIKNAANYVADHNMVVTNNSYGDVLSDCFYMGFYDLQSRIMDLQSFSLPNLQHVFASGNDGTKTCAPYPAGFRTVISGYQSAKNILTIGAVQRDGTVASFSARGPVKDGRIKPELTIDGVTTVSTIPDDSYSTSNGTSMSAPAVAGGLALLYQRYRQLNAGADPKNALMKALISNGTADIGNTGPDFSTGFGRMNLLRSVDMLNKNRYFSSTINNGGSSVHSISVPSGTAILKVMLYWNDPAAAVFASQTLVNDLDLELTTPASSTRFPFKLDTLPSNVNSTATTGADHINNIEQIVIANPASGIHTVTIKGFSVPSGPQEYFLVYDIIPVETKIVYPIGNEGLNPGQTIDIQWESYGDPANTFTVEYSINNGSSWTTIDAAVAASSRKLSWLIPSVVTHEAMVRVSKNSTGFSSSSSSFTIIGIPVLSLTSVQCEGYFSFGWPAIPEATDYEIFQLQGTEMVSIGLTTSTSYMLSGLSNNTEYWVAVCPRINGVRGRRSVAIKRVPNDGDCTGAISDNDLKMDSIIAPVYGRIATSTALSTSTTVSARIKNLDDASVSNFKMRYFIGGVLIVEDLITTTVNPGTTYTHLFSLPYNFSTAGNYILRVEVENTSGPDAVSNNNFIVDTIRQLANNVLTLPFNDNLESATARIYYKKRFGLDGIDRYDFFNTMSLGRVSTFLRSGMAFSGTKSLILDLDGWNGATGNSNFIHGTFNLAGKNAVLNDIRLDFQFKSHGDSVSNASNRVWIRGNDQEPWVEAYSLSSNKNIPGIFKRTSSLEISRLLSAAGQDFSSSFQVRWGQFGVVRVVDDFGFQGHNFDDIRLYEAIDDIQLVSIDTPIVNSCGLNSTVPVKITIRNASPSSINNIPVRLKVNGITITNETIILPSTGLAAYSSYQYTFTAVANLGATGNHSVFVTVLYPSDNFNENDTATVFVVNTPVINTFPHLENFENGSGNWYSGGKNSSWEFGTPGSVKINKAASGVNAWKTRMIGNYNDNEISYLYSPCYDLSGMTNPALSFMVALDLENCGNTFCDGVYVEYSEDGKTWSRLGTVSAGTNWYNKKYENTQLWSVENYTRWHVVTTSLPTGVSRLRLRVVVNSDPFVNFEGIAIDDIHIYEKTREIYDGMTIANPVNQNITGGTSWVDFIEHVSGKLVASIQPNNQSIGSTNLQSFINNSGIRNDGLQYYHDRNITIKPTTTSLTDSVIIRFYFLDAETDSLIFATRCGSCYKPAMVTELGVTKYSDADDEFENGSLADNTSGSYSFLSAAWNKKVPFDKGYYIEFKVKDFSEFWLNNGGLNKKTPLPVKIIDFNAKKKNEKDVLLEWKISAEQNVNRYEIEVAKGTGNYQQQQFEKIGEVLSPGNTSADRNYEFTDTEPEKSGVRYYRLKIVDLDNSFEYTRVKPVTFNNDVKWQVYPNPSKGIFNFVYQLGNGENIRAQLHDASGKQVHLINLTGNGFLQKTVIDLRSPKYASGIYLLNTIGGDKTQSLKLIKH